jgi:hypothetical protein
MIVGGILFAGGIYWLLHGYGLLQGYLLGGFFVLGGLLRILTALLGTGSAHIVPFIDRSAIEAVSACEPSRSSNRGGHFTVSFERNGKTEQLAIAPRGGRDEYATAHIIMHNAGLLTPVPIKAETDLKSSNDTGTPADKAEDVLWAEWAARHEHNDEAGSTDMSNDRRK